MFKQKVFVYVDTENISSNSWHQCFHQLEKNDYIYIPLTSNSGGSLTLSELNTVYRREVNVDMSAIPAGTKNALDFCLVFKLSEQVVKNPDAIHIILSEDTGYTPVIEQHADISIYRFSSWGEFMGSIEFSDTGTIKKINAPQSSTVTDNIIPINSVQVTM